MDNVIPIQQTSTPVNEQPQTEVPAQEPQVTATPAPGTETPTNTSTPGTLPSIENFIKETSATQGISEDILRSVIKADPDSFAGLYSSEPEQETAPEAVTPTDPSPETRTPTEQEILKAEILQLRGQLDSLTRSQLEALKQQQTPQETEKEKAPKSTDPVAEMVKSKVEEALKTDPRIQAFERQQASQKQVEQVEAAEAAVKASHKDYDEVTAPIIQSIQLAAQAAQGGDVRARAFIESVFSQPNPAEYIYTIGARAKYEQLMKAQQTIPSTTPAPQQTQQHPQLTPEQQATLDKAKQNAAMPVGPSIGGDNGTGGTLTMEQISQMTAEQWIALPESVRIQALSGQI